MPRSVCIILERNKKLANVVISCSRDRKLHIFFTCKQHQYMLHLLPVLKTRLFMYYSDVISPQIYRNPYVKTKILYPKKHQLDNCGQNCP